MPPPADLWYALDPRNVISDIGGSWGDLARASGGQDAFHAAVVDRPLFGFVSGTPTRQFLDGVFFNVRRTQSAFSLKYRCDTACTHRIHQMTVSPGDNGHLIIGHRLVQSADVL